MLYRAFFIHTAQ